MLKGILVAVPDEHTTPETCQEYLDELAFLAETNGITTVKQFVQRLDHPDMRTFVGKGKLDEIKNAAFSLDIDCLLFDDDLSASQLRNLEKALTREDQKPIRVYDRSLLILEIFQKRAQSAAAKTQVELAMNEYLLPRLTRLWTHLERQRGGTGTRGGAGEKEIETDRRMIRTRIKSLKEELQLIDRQRQLQRKNRTGIRRVALVGYTNAGKSTIMKLLSKSDVLVENKLFATVDATVRKVVINQTPFLLSDTVGFIRKLPHHLIESFKSTLDEVREADLLLHVVDIAHPYHDHHIQVVKQTLNELNAGNKPTLLIFNQCDRLTEPANEAELTAFYKKQHYSDVLVMSAIRKDDRVRLQDLLAKWMEVVKIQY